MIRKIVITGPESTGKTTLASKLSEYYATSKVGEYAREYLSTIVGEYTFDDVLLMAKKQLEIEELAVKKTSDFIFLDTDLLVYKIWIKERYNKEIDWIETHLQQATDKIYFLCDIDVPWEFDKLREHPEKEDRVRLFDEYKKQLNKYNLTYYVVSGNVDERMKQCEEVLNLL